MYTYTNYNIRGAIPLLLLLSPLADFLLLSLLIPFTYLETLLAVTGSIHPGLRLLVNWPPLSQPFPNPFPLQIPRTQVTKRLTMTTSRIRLLLSRTSTNIILDFRARRRKDQESIEPSPSDCYLWALSSRLAALSSGWLFSSPISEAGYN